MLVRRIAEGGLYPDPLNRTSWWPYGVVYDDFERCEVVCAPIPLNLLWRLCRAIWWSRRLRSGRTNIRCDRCGRVGPDVVELDA